VGACWGVRRRLPWVFACVVLNIGFGVFIGGEVRTEITYCRPTSRRALVPSDVLGKIIQISRGVLLVNLEPTTQTKRLRPVGESGDQRETVGMGRTTAAAAGKGGEMMSGGMAKFSCSVLAGAWCYAHPVSLL